MALARPWALIALLSPEQACRPTALALGSFDGVHAGHRHVIARAVAMAAGPPALVPTVLSFWPHPREVLAGEPRLRLDLPNEKLSVLGPLGIEQLVLVPFDLQLAALSPEQFVQQVLRDQLQAGAVVIGENFRFGNRRSGGPEDLQRLGAACGGCQSGSFRQSPPPRPAADRAAPAAQTALASGLLAANQRAPAPTARCPTAPAR